jgi:type I restriction enzyme S subunit
MKSKVETTDTTEAVKPALVPKLRFPEFRDAPIWATKPLKELGDFSSGGTPSKDNPEYWNGHIPWISASSMYTTAIAKSDHHVTAKAIGSGTRIAPKGSFLILVRGSMLFNRVPMGIAEIDVAFNQDVKALAPNGRVNTKFLLYFLSAIESQIPINETGIGAGKIDTDVLKALPIPLPQFAEQQKIAECLSSVDELMAAQARKVDALKTHKKGLMQQLFPREGETQPRLRFPEFQNAGQWKDQSVGDFGKVVTGSTPRTAQPAFYGGGIPFVSPADISDLRFVDQTKTTLTAEGFAETRPIRAGSTLFVCIGSTIGKVAQNVYDCATNQQINAVIPSSKHSDGFVYFVLSLAAERIAMLAGRQAVPIINKSLFSSVRILAPKLPEQQRISSCLSSLDALITAETQNIEALKTHKKGLMQQLFQPMEEISQ